MRLQLLLATLVLTAALAGCAGDDGTPSSTTTGPAPPAPVQPMNFTVHNLPAVHTGHGLYEPTIDVSPTGIIYVSAHSTGVNVQGAPAYVSRDDGATWANLPLAAVAVVPPMGQAGTPPPSDEVFIVAGDDGTAWGVDISLVSFAVHGWCNDGAENCYVNPNAYDRSATSCAPASLADRPWAAYANGTLLMVNNNGGLGGGAPVQVAAMQVPPAEPVGTSTPATGPEWNMCAGSRGFIPGIPDMREDLFFAVPQVQGSKVAVITGHATDVMTVEEHVAMEYDNTMAPGSQIGEYGQAAFDATGTLFVAAMANNGTGAGDGGFAIAVSLDDGRNFTSQRFAIDLPVSSVYVDGNRHGPGLLVNWGVVDASGTDWYFGHVFVEGGMPVLRNVHLAVDDGPAASRHVQGAAVGPDGRAYMVMSEVSGNDDAAMAAAAGTTPLFVVVQSSGVTLPVAAAPSA